MGQHRQSSCFGLFNETVHPFLLGRVDYRAAVQVHLGGADPHLFEFFSDQRDEFIVDGLLHQQAAACGTGLAGVLNDAAHDSSCCEFEVGVLKHHMRRFAAQLQRAFDRVTRSGLLHQHADFVGTGEADEVDVRVLGQGRTGFFAQDADDVQSACGKACFKCQFGDAQTTHASVFGGFDHHGVTHGQRRRDAAAHHLCRVVPRNDVRGYAQRFAQQVDLVAVQKRNHFAVHFVGCTGIKLKVTGQHNHVVASRCHGLAGVFGFQQRQFFAMFGHQMTELHHQTAAFAGVEFAPVAGECSTRGAHGQIDVSRLAAGNVFKHLTVNRRAYFQCVAADGLAGLACNDHVCHVLFSGKRFSERCVLQDSANRVPAARSGPACR